MQVLETLCSYVPYPLAMRLLHDPYADVLGRVETVEAVALFVDIAGFTPMARALGELGAAGAEYLARILNDRFHVMVETTHHWGGVISNFAGDAISVFFTGEAAAERAVVCAIAIRDAVDALGTAATPGGTFEIKVKQGLAAGSLRLMVVGNDLHAEWVTAGEPLDLAAAAEHRAFPGNIVLHQTVLDALSPGTFDTLSMGRDYFRLQAYRAEPAPAPPPPLPEPHSRLPVYQQVRRFLTAEVYARVQSGMAPFVEEHRIVTVLFVSFSGMEETPDAIAALQTYVDQAVAIIYRLGGYLHQIEFGDKGSKLLVVFGAPVAHEDDATRALHCALELCQLSHDIPWLHAQMVGINTGVVFVGNIGNAHRQTYTILGDPINMAARLMQSAAPNVPLVAAATYRAARAVQFQWETSRSLHVKGALAPVVVFPLLGYAQAAISTLQEPAYALPMVGRETELRAIVEIMQIVLASGKGAAIGIIAEAGMGKSRLAAEVIREAFALGYQGLGGAAVSHGASTPYLAWRDVFRNLLGITAGQSPEAQIAAAEGALREFAPELVERLPLCGPVLGIPIPDSVLTQGLRDAVRKDSLHEMLPALLRQRAQANPLLLVIEDAHWLDDLSRELLRDVVLWSADVPLCTLIVYRPWIEEATQLWERPPAHFTEFRLGTFTHAETAQLIRLKWQQADLPAGFVDAVVEKAQGNPFFIDEFINLLQDRGVTEITPEMLSALEMPKSLQALIAARLDRLDEMDKLTIRVASVIGRLFRARWLLAIYPGEAGELLLRRSLDRLSQLDLVPVEREQPELEYLFRHVLTQEVAYSTLSLHNRQVLHRRIAAYIEETYPAELEAWAGVLAYHFHAAEDFAKEFAYLRMAAEYNVRQSAVWQAIRFYDRLLALLPEFASQDAALAFDIHAARFEQNLIVAATEALQVDATEIWELAPDMDLARQTRAWIIRGKTAYYLGRGLEAEECYETALEFAGNLDTLELRVEAESLLGGVYFGLGRYPEGKALLEEVITTVEAIDADEMATARCWGHATRACQALGWIVYDEGDYARCGDLWERGLALARRYGEKTREALLLTNLGALQATIGETEKALSTITQGIALAEELGYLVGQLEGWRLKADIELGVGLYAEAIADFERLLVLARRRLKNAYDLSMGHARMAEAVLAHTGGLERADALSAQAVQAADDIGPEGQGWVYHTRGRMLMRLGQIEAARDMLESSACLRRDLRQFDPLMSTLTDLGLLHLQRGDHAAARAILAELQNLLRFEDEQQGEQIVAGYGLYRLLDALGEPEAARDAWLRTHALLQKMLAQHSPCLQAALRGVPVHREILDKAHEAFEGVGETVISTERRNT